MLKANVIAAPSCCSCLGHRLIPPASNGRNPRARDHHDHCHADAPKPTTSANERRVLQSARPRGASWHEPPSPALADIGGRHGTRGPREQEKE